MATVTQSSEDEDDNEKALEDTICKVQKAKQEIVDCTIPFSEILAKLSHRERKYCTVPFSEELAKLAQCEQLEKQRREKEQQIVKSLPAVQSAAPVAARSEILDSSNVTDFELNRVKCENVELKQSLEEAAKQSKTQLEKIAELECSVTVTQLELNETRQRLSDVQERLTVAEQVTAATQQRALQESGNSEQLQLELTPQHQPTTHSGLRVSFTSV